MNSSGTGDPGRQRLGRYHLGDLLGGGPNGVVYRAKVYGVAGFERQFAVKRFHADLVRDPNIAKRLSAVARQYGNLEHPRVARLQEFAISGGETFAAVEFVEGLNWVRLSEMTRGRGAAIDTGSLLGLVSAASRAVGYAHGLGFAHLGLCPQNVITTPEGDVKVTDFGFLSCRLPERPHNETSLDVRTPYLAPEQLAAEDVSPATDVFQLGVMAWELLTGRRPFGGRSAFETAQNILSAAPPEADLPKEVVDVLHQALARAHHERYLDAAAFADAVDAAARKSGLQSQQSDVAAAVNQAMAEVQEIVDSEMSGAFSFSMPTMATASATTAPMPATAGNTTAVGMPSKMVPPPHRTTEEFDALVTTTYEAQNPAPESRPITSEMGAVSGIVEAAPTEPIDVMGDDLSADHTMSAQAEPPGVRTSPSVVAAPRDAGAVPVATLDTKDTVATVDPSFADPTAEEPISAPPPRRTRSKRTALLAIASGAGVVAAVVWLFAPALFGPSSEPVAQQTSLESPEEPTFTVEPEEPAAREPAVEPTKPSEPAEMTPPTETAKTPEPKEVEPPAVEPTKPPEPKEVEPPTEAAKTPEPKVPSKEPVKTTEPTKAPAMEEAPSEELEKAPEPTVEPAEPNVPGEEAQEKHLLGEDAEAKADLIPGQKLYIESAPSGAEVLIDGVSRGVTPLVLPAREGTYKMTFKKPGYRLFVGEATARGTFNAVLQPAERPTGPAGIKVVCNESGRYHVFVDDVDTGQVCPTERIPVSLGRHRVDVVDLVDGTRKSFKVRVRETRLSKRVRVD